MTDALVIIGSKHLKNAHEFLLIYAGELFFSWEKKVAECHYDVLLQHYRHVRHVSGSGNTSHI